MPEELGQLLADRRRKLKKSLRDVEQETGIKNAHLSQIETGGIERPAPNLLWALATAYDLDFKKLMRLAGHVHGKGSTGNRGALLNAAFRALDDLPPARQEEAVVYLEKLRNEATHRK